MYLKLNNFENVTDTFTLVVLMTTITQAPSFYKTNDSSCHALIRVKVTSYSYAEIDSCYRERSSYSRSVV